MIQETDGAHGLWVHQESTIIGAESHDIWSFTPEFLLSNDIVPKDWVCTLATRSENGVTIQYGPIRWSMTENSLWITSYPDCPLEDESRFKDGHIIPVIAKRYLERVPFLPAQRMWLFWRLSVLNPMAREWMLDTFLSRGWPDGFQHSTVQPNLAFVVDDTLFQMSIKNEQSRLNDNTFEESIIFECFASNSDREIENMIIATDHLSARLNTLKEAINHLLDEGSS